MDKNDLEKLFDKYNIEYGKFDRVENKRSRRPDLHAFILLDEMCRINQDWDIIWAAEHDEIFISIEPEDIAETITEDRVIELVRCGLRFDPETDSFAMFV